MFLCLLPTTIMSEFTPAPAPAPIAPGPTADGTVLADTPEDAPEPLPITDNEVGEYREQDRFLPVRLLRLPFCTKSLAHSIESGPPPDCQRSTNNEIFCTADGKDRQRREGMRAGMCVGVHQLHYFRSSGEVPDGKAQNYRRGGHFVRND